MAFFSEILMRGRIESIEKASADEGDTTGKHETISIEGLDESLPNFKKCRKRRKKALILARAQRADQGFPFSPISRLWQSFFLELTVNWGNLHAEPIGQYADEL